MDGEAQDQCEYMSHAERGGRPGWRLTSARQTVEIFEDLAESNEARGGDVLFEQFGVFGEGQVKLDVAVLHTLWLEHGFRKLVLRGCRRGR